MSATSPSAGTGSLPVPRAPRYESLDMWRGFACLAVVIFHSVCYALPDEPIDEVWPLLTLARNGWIGVPIFFVISGYCISATADRSRRKGFGFADYSWRRFRRIFPPYWIFLILAVVMVASLDVLIPRLYTDSIEPIPRPWWRTGWQWLGNITLTETWRQHVVGDSTGFFMSPAWTLCYEEQFYLVTGLILLFARRFFFAIAGVLTLAVIAVASTCEHNGCQLNGFFFDGSWLMFAAGVLIYFGVNYRGAVVRWSSLALFAGVTTWSLVDHESLDAQFGYRADYELAVATAFAAILLLLHPWDRKIASMRALEPLRICGLMCYSLYLIHWPIVKPLSNALSWAGITSHVASLTITVPICVAVSCAVAWQFHKLVERRFLNSPAPRRTATTAPAAQAPAPPRALRDVG